jgi:myosin-9
MKSDFDFNFMNSKVMINFFQGLYRKSGTTSKISELKQKLEEKKSDIDLDSYSVHVLTAALKSFFREMPEPLMTFELYDDFLWSIAISDPQERVQSIYSHISKLPRSNYDLLERLVFHLARVAQQESANRMTANSLAIVFAPCILRTNKVMQMQDKLSDISKQTMYTFIYLFVLFNYFLINYSLKKKIIFIFTFFQ